MCNDYDVIRDATVVDNLPSCDHDAIQFILKLSNFLQPCSNRVLFNFNKADLDVFCADLATVLWDLIECSYVNEWWMNWRDLLLTTATQSIKWKQTKMKYWLSYETIGLIKKKWILYWRLKRCGGPTLCIKYNSLRNIVCSATRADYASYQW